MMAPVAINASTTYGLDTSGKNNYGLGPTFASSATLRRRQKAKDAQPSVWWLVGLLVALAVL